MTTATADNLTRSEAALRAAVINNVTYDVALTLTAEAGDATFVSTSTIRFTSSDGSSVFLDLDARSVVSIELNGTPVDPDAFDGARVHLASVAAGDNVVVVVANCAYQNTGVGIHRIVDPVDGEVYLYSHCEPFDAHRIFACFDQPDLKAAVTLHVTAPTRWEIVANNPVERSDDGAETRTLHFATTPPISTYLVACVAGPFHRFQAQHNGIDLGIYCRRSLSEYVDADEFFEITRQGLDFFTDYFARPYPFTKYDQCLVPEFNMGAMENPGCVTFNESFIFRAKVTESTRSRRANTILHEMAHMWFGDLVTMRWWDDLWLNESFATYMAHLCLDSATRFDDSWVDFAVAMKNWALRQDQLPTTHAIAADMIDTHSVHLNFDGITYAKGASVLRQLVAWVGDDAFRDGIRAYFDDHAWDNATLADFLRALEASSGRDLAAWSKEWLETAGVNRLAVDVTVANGKYTEFAVVQTATDAFPTLRSHRVAIGLYDIKDNVLTLRRSIEADVKGVRTVIADAAGEAEAALIVVNDRDLTFAKPGLDDRSVKTLVESGAEMSDPLARGIISTALWNNVRDAEMATSDYVRIVAQQSRTETAVSTLERLLAQANLAIEMYGAPAERTATRRQLWEAAHAGFAAATHGSDEQLVWARTVIATADGDALDELANWLESEDVDGLVVDTDLRWTIVTRLASAGRLSDADIDAESERDPSDIGARRAVSARAARPTAAAKEAAWAAVISDASLSLQTANAAMDGFAQPDQLELAAPYVTRYFEILDTVWATRGVETAKAITEGFFPQYLLSDEVLHGADAALARETLAPMARRILLEGRDGAQRALRARERAKRGSS